MYIIYFQNNLIKTSMYLYAALSYMGKSSINISVHHSKTPLYAQYQRTASLGKYLLNI